MNKIEDIEYPKPFTVERAGEGPDPQDGPVVMVISDESVDSFQTRFLIDGWDLNYAKRNPIVTFGHPPTDSTDDTLYIGRHEVYKEDGKLKARVYFNRDNPRAVRIEKAVRNGFLHMASIRASINDAREVKHEGRNILEFTSHELFDFGIVPHGSNKNAFVEQRARILEKIRKHDEEEVVPTPSLSDEEMKAYRANTARAKELINKLKKR